MWVCVYSRVPTITGKSKEIKTVNTNTVHYWLQTYHWKYLASIFIWNLFTSVPIWLPLDMYIINLFLNYRKNTFLIKFYKLCINISLFFHLLYSNSSFKIITIIITPKIYNCLVSLIYYILFYTLISIQY